MARGVRKATAEDIPAMVALTEQKREQYEQYQPVFWRRAADAAERQAAYFERLLQAGEAIALVFEREGDVRGFLVGQLVPAPPVYAPGGNACYIDDFWVRERREWPSVGTMLMHEVARQARERGAVHVVAVTGHQDEAKRSLLGLMDFGIASEWHVREL